MENFQASISLLEASERQAVWLKTLPALGTASPAVVIPGRNRLWKVSPSSTPTPGGDRLSPSSPDRGVRRTATASSSMWEGSDGSESEDEGVCAGGRPAARTTSNGSVPAGSPDLVHTISDSSAWDRLMGSSALPPAAVSATASPWYQCGVSETTIPVTPPTQAERGEMARPAVTPERRSSSDRDDTPILSAPPTRA